MILVNLGGMLTTVAFDHEFFLIADKINDVRADGRLPSELEAFESFGTQVSPQMSLGIG